MMPSQTPPAAANDRIPFTLIHPGAGPVLVRSLAQRSRHGSGRGSSDTALGSGATLLEAVEHTGPWRHILVLVAAGLLTGAGQIVLKNLSSGDGIDTTAAI